jgi:hypothetical protein
MKTQPLLLTLFAVPLLSLACSSSNGVTPPTDAGHDRSTSDAGAPDQASGKDAAADPVLFDDPLSMVSGSAEEHEPFVAVSPGGRVAVSFLSFLSSGTAYTEGYRISNDRGVTWGAATLFPVPSGDNVQANASVAAGDDDTLYMAWAAEERTETGRANEHVFVATSTPGSTTFGTPVEVTDPSVAVSVYDQPRITVTHAGVIDVGYLEDSADGNTAWIQIARSTDGKSWKRSYAAGPGSYQSFRNEARFCRPEGEGRIFLLYLDSDVALYSYDLAVALRYSDDDGGTWSSPLDVTTEADELILDPTANLGCTTDGTDVWMVYGLTPEANLGGANQGSPELEHTMTRVRLAHSGDGGKTIDARSDVLDTRAGTRAMYPVLVGEGQGTLDLSYYVGNADNDPKAGLRRSRSLDGKTFPPTALVHQPLTLETSRSDPRWVGDYVGGAFQGGDLFLVFTDNATATPHIAFYRTPSALPAGSTEPDASAPPLDGGSDASCYTAAAFTPVTWAPPSAFGQGACTSTQVSAYLACQGSGDCSTFRSASANAGCLACLETDVAAAAHGPFVTEAGDGGVSIVEVNYGGCQAHFDSDSAKGSCGEQGNNFNDCVNLECETCSDFQSPTEYGPTYDCYYWAIDVGVCTAYRETTPCSYETLDGGSAVACNDPTVFVPLWCGM